MALPIAPYDPSRVSQQFGDIVPSMYGPDSRISVTPTGASFTVMQGQDGHITRVKVRATHHLLSFVLMKMDPANDLLDLLDMAQGQGTDSVYGSILESLNPALRVPVELGSGYTASGVPLDTPIQMTEQFDAIANSGDGGRAVIEKVAYRKNGKWYWRSVEAPFLMAETFPLLNNVTKLTRPWSDGDSYNQKIFGMIARFMGSPVRAVPEAEQDRAERGARMRDRMERQDAARRR